jgi:hypothetical protein
MQENYQPVGPQPPVPAAPFAAQVPPPPFQMVPPPQVQKKNDGYAITALVTGLGGLIIPIAGIVAIVFGVLAKKRIKESGGAFAGEGMATAGFILGIVECAYWLAWFAWLR